MQVNNLTHPTMQAKLFGAMQRARLSSLAGNGGQVYVKNKKGQPAFRVKHTRGNGGGFDFHKGNKNITQNVLTSLRA